MYMEPQTEFLQIKRKIFNKTQIPQKMAVISIYTSINNLSSCYLPFPVVHVVNALLTIRDNYTGLYFIKAHTEIFIFFKRQPFYTCALLKTSSVCEGIRHISNSPSSCTQ